ncbi:MAG: Bor/Iss family lipoprotein [Alistipes sp.]|jgi:bor protein|uniref:Bor/Iss family lipoprotein n=1 Tax=Alistipes sp. TaxID=1872444 RepID=UPI001DFA1B76|nr:hypothetical protein [Alistipes sp.]MBS6100299.1 hypothetical protein [Alistipes sp.]HJI19223.1 Bor family protein [Rikenellaceae bacterium]
MKKYLLILLCSLCATSCYTSRLLVGDVRRNEPMIEVSKQHNAHYIGGLVKTGKSFSQDHIGDAQNYAITTRYGFGDMMLSVITAGIYTPTTTKYFIPIRHMEQYTPPALKEKKHRIPVHKQKGFELSINGELMFPSGNTLFGYSLGLARRFSSHFTLGLHAGAGHSDGEMLVQGGIFARYMFLDRKVTPYLEADATYFTELEGYGADFACAVTPRIGCQFRMGKNAYYNLSAGYSVSVYDEWWRGKWDGLSVKTGFSFVF